MKSAKWEQIARTIRATPLRSAVLQYLVTILIVFAMCWLLPVDTLGDTRGILVFLVIIGCAWYGGIGPGLAALLLTVVLFKYRAYGFPECLEFSLVDLRTMIVLAVVTGVVGWAGVLRRQSQAIARRQAIELRELHQRKDQFLATLAHELRNPLAPLRNGIEVLRLASESTFSSPDLAEVHSMLKRQVEQLVRLIDDLLDVSRFNVGKIELQRERVQLADVVRDAVETSRPHFVAAQHELAITIPDTSIVIDVDRARIAQVLINLLNNAAKFTPHGGKISLCVVENRQYVEISLSDSGIGISEDMLPKVFDMFTQASNSLTRTHGGLGIGLSLARSLTEMHGGELAAFSEGTDRGSKFVLTLPKAPGERPGERNSTAGLGIQRTTKLAGLRILIVDDNQDAGHSLAMLLETCGHQCFTVGDGPAGLERANAIQPDVFLLDIGMPGMSGYELAALIRAQARFKNSTLIAVTGWGHDEDRRRSKAAGFEHHLVKPVSLTALIELLNAVVSGRSRLQDLDAAPEVPRVIRH